ncbi:phosphotransferase [Shimia sp. SDUM112013]|uniref:phosphotransferase enzyme family protein n=1 Tax=Shimia sp. SDUM112013 TaxID=3136160 RepID=UPI0032EB1E51
MTDPTVQQALPLWGLDGAQTHLLAQRENHVYAVQQDNTRYALRLHRPGYRTTAELASELDWMTYLADQGLHVPVPIPARNGATLLQIDEAHISLLSWLDGPPIGAGTEITQGNPCDIAHLVGAEMARLHDLTDRWHRPSAFTRPDWTADAILGSNPLWGRFWDHPDLTPDQKDLLQKARRQAHKDSTTLTDIGLIHADLLTENIVLHEGGLGILDFDDCAIGYRAFELATFLLRYLERPDFNALRAAVMDGYRLRRTIPTQELDLALLLRALTYVGWIIPRLHEPGGEIRSKRMIARATRLAKTYLEGTPP